MVEQTPNPHSPQGAAPPPQTNSDRTKTMNDTLKSISDFFSGQGFPVTVVPGPATAPELYEPYVETLHFQNGSPDIKIEDPARSEGNDMLELAALDGILDDNILILKLGSGKTFKDGVEAVRRSCQTCSTRDHAQIIARVTRKLANRVGMDMNEVPDVPLVGSEQEMNDFLRKIELVTMSLSPELK